MTQFADRYGQFARPYLEHAFGETVTYTVRRTDATAQITGAIRQDLSLERQSLGLALGRATSLIWTIPKSRLDDEGITPQRGDTFTDAAGVVWTIQKWKLTAQGTIYEFDFEQGTI